MHIPDGYLSPSTCVAMYGVAAPFWYVALRKIKTRLHTKVIPRLALFAAFSFVLMMFNIPLPGGTSGHATGAGLAAVVLGPWAGMLAISTALLIQTLFFGDGGVTAFGANAFNMAIAGCLVTSATYTILRSIFAKRTWGETVAASVAAYIAINVSALLTAIEFGIQPVLFHDSMGHPMYAPFPLSVAVPAMLIGHLTIAGLAELFITGGVVAYLKRASPELITPKDSPSAPTWKPIAAILAILVILTPLGLLVSSHGWGEWTAKDFQNAEVRLEIQKSSGGAAVPAQTPIGIKRLSNFWKAPMRDYSPGFITNAPAGYVVSAVTGVVLLMGVIFAFGAIFGRKKRNA